MGIDYLVCKNCGEGFPDVIDYVSCDCGSSWCCDDCADVDDYEVSDYYDEEEDEIYEGEGDSTCNYCRGESFEDYELLTFALNKLGYSKEQLIDLYKEEK